MSDKGAGFFPRCRSGRCGRTVTSERKASRRWKLFITARLFRFSLRGLTHLTDTAIMASELLIRLIVNEKFDEQVKTD